MLPSPLPFRGAAVAFALLLAAGCGVDPALQVHVTLPSAVKASCVQLSVFPSADVSGAPVESTRLARPPGKDELYLAIYKGALPTQVWVTARPLWGTECQEPLLPNGTPAVVSGSFPPSGVTPVELALSAPSATEDKDGDGFVGPPGADCNDDLGAVNPGADERCQEPGDFDCDGRIGCADPGCPATACLASPTTLAFATPPMTLVAGACSGTQVTVQTRDGTGVLAVVTPTPVAFLSPDSTLQIFSDTQCQTPLSSVVIPTGSSSASAYISGTVAGAGTLQASAPGLGSVTQTETIQPAATSQVVFTTAPQTVPLNGCSQEVTVQLRDPFGNPTPVGTTRPLALSSNGGASFRFYLDAACATTATNQQVPVIAGASTATFFFKSTSATAGTVTVTVADGPRSANQAATLVQRTPTQLAFTTGPFSVPQGACSQAVTVQTQDASGQPAPVSTALSVGLGVSPGGALTFYSDTGCTTTVNQVTIGVGLNSASFHFRGNQQGAATVTATGGAFGSPQQTETITAPLPTQLAFTTAAQTSVMAGQCSGPVDIDAQTSSGVATPVTANTTINLATTPNGQLSLYAGPGCTGSPISSTTMAAGTSRVTLSFRGTVVGTTTITASTPGSALAQAQQMEGVVAAAASRLRIVSGGGQSVDINACSGVVTFELQDAFNNPVTAASAVTVNLSSTPSGAATFSQASNCGTTSSTAQISAGAQRGSFYFKGSTAQTISVAVASGSLTGDSAQQTIRSAPPTTVRFTSAEQNAVVAGTCSAPVVLTTYDAANNVAPVTADTQVSLAATGLTGPVSFFAGPSCSGQAVVAVTIPNGSSSVTWSFSTERSGNGNLSAVTSGLGSPTQPVTVTPAAPTQLRFTMGPITVPAGSCSGSSGLLAIESLDAFGNPSKVGANLDVTLSASNPATQHPLTFFSNNNCNTNGTTTTIRINGGNTTSGTFTFRTNGAGTWAFTGAASGSGLTSAAENQTVTPLAPSKLAFTTGTQMVQRNDCSGVVSFQLQDTHGNPSPPSSATDVSLTPGGDTFYSRQNCSGAIAGNIITLNAGVAGASYYFQAPGAAGSYSIGISAGGGITGANQSHTIQ